MPDVFGIRELINVLVMKLVVVKAHVIKLVTVCSAVCSWFLTTKRIFLYNRLTFIIVHLIIESKILCFMVENLEIITNAKESNKIYQ